jgi:hypothetical protein
LAEGVRLQQAIADLNTNTLPTLCEQLPAPQARALRDRYLQMVFPAVYAFEDNGLDLCERTLSNSELNVAQREAITAMCDAYRTAYQAICHEMERKCAEWQDHFARTRFTMNKYEPYRYEMRDLRDKRWQLTLTLIRQVESAVPVNTIPAVGTAISDLRMRVEARITESKDIRDRYPGM